MMVMIPIWSSRPTKARRNSPISPTASRGNTVSGSTTLSPPAARRVTTTKKWRITARGAWEAIKRHFREMGKDIQTKDFTCIGVGDMSGDVFGNGMLLSKHTQLLWRVRSPPYFLRPQSRCRRKASPNASGCSICRAAAGTITTRS